MTAYRIGLTETATRDAQSYMARWTDSVTVIRGETEADAIAKQARLSGEDASNWQILGTTEVDHA